MTNSDVIAISSVVVATLVFFLTAWQAWLTHRHSILSVKTLLTWSTHRIETNFGLEFVSSLSNKGLGPAIIAERFFTDDGNQFYSDRSGESILEALVREGTLPANGIVVLNRRGDPGIKGVILPGETICISHLVFDKHVLDFVVELGERTEKVGYTIVYEDLYGNRTTLRAGGSNESQN